MNLDDALQTFIAESRELLQDMEAALLRIEQLPDDPELVNAIFRAAHTIKGSAGLFGLEHIVAFTHVAESVLDLVRNGELRIDSDLVVVLLSSCDHISRLVDHTASARTDMPADIGERSQQLIGELQAYIGGGHGAGALQAAPPVEFEPAVTGDGEDGVGADHWHISLRFGPEVLRNGMDPFAFIRYLATLGSIVHIVTLLDAIPPANQMDPETCYLGFEIGFKSDADKAAIESAFEFVRDDCRIRILPPHSKISEYRELIDGLQDDGLRIGEMLVSCGTLTRNELETALAIQQADNAEAPRHIGEVLVDEQIVQPAVVEAALLKQKSHGEPARQQKTIRVDADKLDKLINLIGELVIAGAGADMIAAELGSGRMQEATATMSRLVEEVRDSALSLRMVQIGETFNRFQRVVRDVSRELGKDIGLIVNGADTELDKSVVEKIGDPLMHLVRNSMDHGIEAAELRAARGKPAQGRVELNAYHDSGSIVIEVVDDGGGLDRDRIFAKAVERGLVSPEHSLTEAEIFNLIFEAGFSTAERVSNLSGRGVGMDVVRRNIQSLRGTVEVSSQAGVGSRFTIRLPLTLAIIDGFLVGVEKRSFVIPLDTVVECLELENKTRDRHYLDLRGEVLPLVRLRGLFEIDGEHPERENVVVVRSGSHKAGIVVDVLQGEFQTVIKPLGKLFRHLRGVGGSTILGSGAVALILDVQALTDIAARQEADSLAATGTLH